MKTKFISAAAVLICLASLSASAQQVKLYGFIRNYTPMDTRVCKAGTGDLFNWLPLDENVVNDEDLNQQLTWRSLAITSRVGLNVSGLSYKEWKYGAKIETDFYSLNGNTAILRLRQAYLTVSKDNLSIKMGQAWHPMAADLVNVFALNTGAPFSPFSRTPQLTVDYKLDEKLTLTGSLLSQMQYVSTGPAGSSSNYMKNGGGEAFVGAAYKLDDHLTLKAGADMLLIRPRWNDGTQKVSDKLFTVSPYVYAKYVDGPFQINGRIIFHQAGEHMGLMGGYALLSADDDTNYTYTPTQGITSNISATYQLSENLKAILFVGYMKNLGLRDEVSVANYAANFWFNGNSTKYLNGAARVTPALLWSFGKLDLGIEYEMTAAGYGTIDMGSLTNPTVITNGCPTQDLHSVINHRIQSMVKLNF